MYLFVTYNFVSIKSRTPQTFPTRILVLTVHLTSVIFVPRIYTIKTLELKQMIVNV